MGPLNSLDQIVENLIDGESADLAIEFFSSITFLRSRIEAGGLESAVRDIDRALNSALHFCDHEIEGLVLIRDTLRLAESIVGENAQELPSQLRGRLDRYDHPIIQLLLDDLENWGSSTWLDPATPSLVPPEADTGVLLKRHGAQVNTGRFVYNGQRFVSAGMDSQIIVWDLERRSIICRIATNGNVSVLAAAERVPALLWASQSPLNPYISRTAIVWNTDCDVETCKLAGHGASIVSATISSDGRRAATIDQDGLLIAWSLPSGHEISRHHHGAKGIWNLKMNASGSHLLLSVAWQGFMSQMFEILGQNSELEMPGDEASLGARLSILKIDESTMREIWGHEFDDMSTLEMTAQTGAQPSSNNYISEDGTRIALLTTEEIQVHEIGHEEPVLSIPIGDSLGFGPALSIDQEFQNFGLVDRAGQMVWGKLAPNPKLIERKSSSRPNFHIGFAMTHPASRRTVYSLSDGSLFVLDPETTEIDWRAIVAEDARSEIGIATLALPVAVSPSGILVAFVLRPGPSRMELTDDLEIRSTTRSWHVMIRNSTSLETEHLLPLGNEQPLSLEFSNDEKTFLANTGSNISLWDLSSGETNQEIDNPSDQFTSSFDLPTKSDSMWAHLKTQEVMNQWQTAVFSPDDRLIAACSPSGIVLIWNIETRKWDYSFHSKLFACTSLSFIPDSPCIAIGGQNASRLNTMVGGIANEGLNPLLLMPAMQMAPGAIHILNYTSEEVVQKIEPEGIKVFRLQITGDGQEGASVTAQGKLDRWKVDTGEIISSFFISRFVQSECLALSADGAVVATGAADGVVRVWDTESEALLASFTTNGAVHTLAASKDLGVIMASDGLGWTHILRASTKCWHLENFAEASTERLTEIALAPETSELLALAATRALGRRGDEGATLLASILDRSHQFPQARADRLIRNATQALKIQASTPGLTSSVMDAIERSFDKTTDCYLLGYLLEPIILIDTQRATDLICRLLTSTFPSDRISAAMILTARPEHGRRATTKLERAALDETEPGILSHIMGALGHADAEDSTRTLVALVASSCEEVQVAALKVLTEQPRPELFATFESMAAEPSAPSRRKALVAGLGEIGVSLFSKATDGFGSGLGGFLLEAMSLGPGARALIASSILDKNPMASRCVELLAEFFSETEDPKVRRLAANYLGKIKTPETATLLIAALQDPAPDLRKAIVSALESYDDPRVAAALARRLSEDPDAEVRQACVATLPTLPGRSVPILVKALEDSDPAVRQTTTKVLVEIGDLDALLPLIRLGRDPSQVVQLSAFEAVRTLSRDFMEGFLTGKVKREQFEALRRITRELQDVDRPETIETWRIMIENLPDKDMTQAWLELAMTSAPPGSRQKLFDALERLGSSRN